MIRALNQRWNIPAVSLAAGGIVALAIMSAVLTPPGTHVLTSVAEGAVMAGSTCSDFLDGAAVGMGIGVLFGCAWCGAAAVIAKGIALFC